MSQPTATTAQALLTVNDVSVEFKLPGWRTPNLRAVDHVSFDVQAGETVGLVGESGSGKSTIGRSILGLINPVEGTIEFDGVRIDNASAATRRKLAQDVQVVFQDPYNSLDPLRTIGHTLTEPLRAAGLTGGDAARAKAASVVERVGLPIDALDRRPSEFSGGQRQRIAIARSLVVNPRLIVCDEAISALDLSTQAQVLNLLVDLQRDFEVAYLFIAHDLTVVRHVSDRVLVLYRGQIMESGLAASVCDDPRHPYSLALWAAAPVHDPAEQARKRIERQASVAGTVSATVTRADDGCPFAARCPHAVDVCRSTRPALVTVEDRKLACHMFDPTYAAVDFPTSVSTTAAN